MSTGPYCYSCFLKKASEKYEAPLTRFEDRKKAYPIWNFGALGQRQVKKIKREIEKKVNKKDVNLRKKQAKTHAAGFIQFDSSKCNNASGELMPVDAFPGGQSQFGVMDMVGNVWQISNDVYDDGSYYLEMIRGGSYFKPTSSWWYVKGGPQPLSHRQILLMVSPGFDRNATVGFRCVKDAQ